MSPLGRWCVWCRQSDRLLEDDHVFPRAIGGTKQISVPACRACQTALSKAEGELARRSIFALHRIAGGPPVRDKKRPKSGFIETRYVLVKGWMGGYDEVALRTGQLPIPLPCIEVDMVGLGEARSHGLKSQDVDRLVESLLEVVKGPPDGTGLLGEISLELLDEHDVHIASDPDFWPRAFLDLTGQPKIRARDPEEAKRLVGILVTLAKRGAFRNHSSWGTGEVSAGTPHYVRIIYDVPSVFRIIAKIAYGVAFLQAGPEVMFHDPFRHVRRYIICEEQEGQASPVRELSEPGSIKDWPEHHLVVVELCQGHLRGIVTLYGACHLVEFGPVQDCPMEAWPTVAMSRINGTKTQFVSGQIAGQVLRVLTDHVRVRSR